MPLLNAFAFRLWSEALWRGVHDLLVEPYENFEVKRAVEGALRAVSCSGPVRGEALVAAHAAR